MRPIARLLAVLCGTTFGIAAVFLSVARQSEAAGAIYFASPVGSGTTCSQAAPCTLSAAVGKALNGDSVYVAGGTYFGTGSAVVVLTESVALLGGWNGAAAGAPVRDPDQFPSRLDGQHAPRRADHR